MRIAGFLCSIVLLAACHNTTERPMPPEERAKSDGKYASILAKCKPLTIDTLRVYSFEKVEDGKDPRENYWYKGVNVDTAEAKLFPTTITEAFMGGGGEIAVCYSFAIDDTHTGIIARTPSMYESSSVKLFVLDNEQDSITDFVELAEVWGDAGDYVQKQSWLYRDKKMNLNAFMWVFASYDHGAEDLNDTTVEKSNYYYVLDLSKPKHDTINRSASSLLKTFQAVVRK